MNQESDFQIQKDLSQPFLHSSSHSLNISLSDFDESNNASFNNRQDPSSMDSIRIEPFESVQNVNNPEPRANTFTTQVKALLIKNISLQSKQKGTNLCQLITPILCLTLLLIVKNIVNAKINTIFDFQMDFPYVFNVPYKRLYNNSFTPIKINDCLQWYLYDFENASEDTKRFIYDNNTSQGILTNVFSKVGNSHKFYYCRNCDRDMPYFMLPTNGSINHQIFNDITYLNEISFTVNEDIPGSYLIPDGAFTFYEASPTNISFKLQINDINFPEYHRGNGVSKFYYVDPQSQSVTGTVRTSDGELSLIDLISRAYLQTINPNVVLMSGSQYMPMPGFETNFLVKLLSTAESCLYPIALSLLLAVFMYTLVLEKEERLREMMKMNGLKMRNYWAANYVWNLFLYLPSAVIFLLFGVFVVQMPFFTGTNIFILILMLIGWGLSQASLSFFFQNFFSKARMVTVIGYMLSIWTTIICVALNIAVFAEPQTLPIILNIYPPIAFCRLVYDFCTRCANSSCVSGFGDLTTEMWISLSALYVGAIFFLLIGLYLEQVWPQEYGVPKHPLFFIKDCFGQNKVKKKVEPFAKSPNLSISQNKNNSIFNLGKVDEDVKEERAFVSKLKEPYHDYPLVIKNLRKVYKATGGKPAKVAVKDFSLHVSKGEMFGLLGPNGAGKTSLISMLTGLYAPESGNAWVAGYNIVNQIDLARTRMGVCPQFDLLWPDLTVREHLLFYARMRGTSNDMEKEVVEKAIEEVQLQKSADFRTKQLSGGMKRRLSVAIALVGEPEIIFLDEPTTGLDPENRRQLWDILAEARGKRAMVLTTHLMEEADVLCTRIGIVTQGQLRCIGRQARLKTKYGSGYHLLINCQTDGGINEEPSGLSEPLTQRILNFIKEILPKAHLKSAFNGSFVFEVPLKGLKISTIFQKLEAHKTELGISDWGLSQSTLEDVFMEVVDTTDESLNH